MTVFSYISNGVAELASRCYINPEELQDIGVIKKVSGSGLIFCRYCNDLNMCRIKKGFTYCQQGDRIYRQSIIICSLCFTDYCTVSSEILSKQQNSISSSPFQKPRLEVTDMTYNAISSIVNKCISELYKCVLNPETIENKIQNILDDINDDGSNVNDANNENITTSTTTSIQASESHVNVNSDSKLKLYDLIKQEYINNHNVRSFFYNNDLNINKDFKRLWPIRYHLQKHVSL